MSFGQTQEEGRPVSIKDEGLTVTPSVSSLDFTGGGVAASAVGNDVEVEVPGGGGGGSGDVVGPGSATDNAIALFDGVTGKLIKNSQILAIAGVLSGVAGITLDAGAALRTATSDTNTLLLQAYDVDGAAYVTFATLTAGNVPTMDLAEAVTKSGGYIYRGGGTDVPVVDGGTGASDAAGARTNLGLGTAATSAIGDFDAAGAAATAQTNAQSYADTFKLSKASNLSDLASAATARGNLGLAIGSDVQAYDATLLSIAALGTAADKIAYTTGVDTWAETAITAFGRSLIDDAAASDGRTTLGLGTMAVQNASSVAITGGTIATLTSLSIGTLDPMTVHLAAITSQLAINSDTQAIQEIHTHSATAATAAIYYAARSRGTTAAPTIVANGDYVRIDSAVAYDGVDYEAVGYTAWLVGGVPGSDDMPGKYVIAVTPDGGFTPVEAMNIASTGIATFAQTVVASITGNAATVTTNANLTGVITSVGNATSIASQTGTGTKFVVDTAPTIATLTVNGTSPLTITQTAATSGSPDAFLLTGAAHTTLTASTEATSVSFNLSATVEFATGALTIQRATYITAPTYGFVGASTLATAATFCVGGSPIAGANATLTRSYSILSQNGNVSFTMNSNAALTVDFLAQNSVGTTRTVTFKGALSAASANADFTFATTGTTRTAGSLLAVVNNATTRFAVAFNGAVTITQAVGTTGAPACFNITGGAHTTLTAGGSFTDISWALARTVQMATGAVSFAKIINITAPTLAFVGASTITAAATLYISGAPTAGTNATITSPYAFYSASGINAFGGDVRFLQQSTEFLVYGTQTSTTYFIIRGNQSAAGTGSDVRIGTSATRTAGWILQLSNVNTVNNQWDYTGGYEMVQGAGATGVRHSLKITAGAHTNQTASTEASEILFDLSATKQFATGALTAQRSVRILAPTYGFVGASTITDAATLYIDKAPVAGTNATITNAWAVWVDAGTSRFDGMLDLSAISAGSPNLKITATSDTPTVTWGAAAGNEASTTPAGYMEINVGGNARYIPYWA